jgi:hypothetical protein
MTAPTIYKSSDASAPTLTGQVGSLIGVLDACLVNGYGAKSAAGWTKAFSGTNIAAYRQASTGLYLSVDDSASGTGGAKEALIRGYEAMTAVLTGTNPFPTSVQIASGLNWRKSTTADATARGWMVIADSRTLYMFVLTGDTAGLYYLHSFGDFYSFKSGDAYKALSSGAIAQNSTTHQGLALGALNSQPSTATVGLFVARSYLQTGTSLPENHCGIANSLGSFNWPVAPNPADGNIYIGRFLLFDTSSTSIRGYVRGLYQMLNGTNLNDGDTFSGSGDFAGRTFVVVKNVGGASQYYAVETTAWDTST